MAVPVQIPLFCLIGFLVGGIPFGYLLGRVILKDDIRNFGSGNTGATNVGRVLGWKWGILVLILDALKGFLPTWWVADSGSAKIPEELLLAATVGTGISAIVGHMYPVYLKLRGGKGVATAVGVVAVLAPKAMLIALGAFLVTLGISRIVAVSSIVAALIFGVSQLMMMGETAIETRSAPLTVFAIGIPLLIIWRHRSNILRLIGRNTSIAEELFDVVDDNDIVVETMPRSKVHQLGLKHRAVHIFLFRKDERLLIHLRHPNKEEFPSVWTSSASGHVTSGETYEHSAQRELLEELGIDATLTKVCRVPACPDTSNEFTELFVAKSDANLEVDPQEITDTRWVTMSEIQQQVATTPEDFSPAFRLLLSTYIQQLQQK